ncbi:MAG TPA: methylated-DNA--[protein]-cysteine S-methyltransferase [Candidatus Saccharimonadales bacterium]|nr:methylated-DNA--[protein]-cysteine S-methyltransferase [Candidatus Saccharimonadales bacterium]
MDDHVAVYRTLPGPYGPYHVAATGRGIVAAEWLASETSFVERLADRLGGRIVPAGDAPATDRARRRLDDANATLEAVLDGAPVDASDIPLDLHDRPDWDRRVLLAVQQLAYGETASYGGIARRIGAPRAARAVGGAMGRNPVTLIVPCHRVIAADGTLGGYGGDGPFERHDSLERKRALLMREGVTVGRRAV